ncbi:MAG: membrane protein insertion efficiency factor YidD [Methylotenera sp.]|nr:membrane protein insertion efficiency factor YidD [Oligoflexia bacterium]
MLWAFHRLNNSAITASVRAYRVFISPFIHLLAGPAYGCRFQPTCSEYAAQALETHGWIEGGRLSLMRVCKCHPWGPMGEDPVPSRLQSTHSHLIIHRKGN